VLWLAYSAAGLGAPAILRGHMISFEGTRKIPGESARSE
jgi:hypothetical protein